VLFKNDAVFALRRTSIDGSRTVICLHNVSAKRQQIRLGRGELGPEWRGRAVDLLGQVTPQARDGGAIEIQLEAYGRAWLEIG
jgi:hypothetical protein